MTKESLADALHAIHTRHTTQRTFSDVCRMCQEMAAYLVEEIVPFPQDVEWDCPACREEDRTGRVIAAEFHT